MTDIDPSVYANFFWVSSQYHKFRQEFSEFYKNALLYLAYTSVESLSESFKLVYLYGSHVTSWKNEHGEELLHLSSKAVVKPPQAIRGGIPLCFPQFSTLLQDKGPITR